MVTSSSITGSVTRVISLMAFVAYAAILCFGILIGFGYAFNPFIAYPWAIMAALLIRIVPVVIYFRLRRKRVPVSFVLRLMAVGVGIVAVPLSCFLLGIAGSKEFSEGVEYFWTSLPESVSDIVPCIVMLLLVESKAVERSGKQDPHGKGVGRERH